jgi:hypothetical protein
MTYCFDTRTGQVSIDHARCEGCDSKACVEACHRVGADILALEGGLPVLAVAAEEARRLDTECLACEIACFLRGRQALTISLPIPGLEQYRSRYGHTVE